MNSMACAKVFVMQKTAPGCIYGGAFPATAVRSGSYLDKLAPIETGNAAKFVRGLGKDIGAICMFGFGPEKDIIGKEFKERFSPPEHKIQRLKPGESAVMMMRETAPGMPAAYRIWGPRPSQSIITGSYLGSDENKSMGFSEAVEFVRATKPEARIIVQGALPVEERAFAKAHGNVYSTATPCGAGMRIKKVEHMQG